MKYLALIALALTFVACTKNETITNETINTATIQTETESNTVTTLSTTSEMVTYYADREVTGYLAQPETPGQYPGIILIHEWWGLNDNIKKMADQYAAQGYTALAIDMYEGETGTNPEEARTLATKVREDREEAFNNINAGINYLKGLDSVNAEKIASVGWCFGGGWSYEIAKNDLGTQASVIYYGRFNPEDDLSIMSTTIQGHFGEEDQSIPVDDVKAFQAKLKTLSGEHQVFIYENAGHAFANDESDAYQEESAQKAWDRTLTFLKENL